METTPISTLPRCSKKPSRFTSAVSVFCHSVHRRDVAAGAALAEMGYLIHPAHVRATGHLFEQEVQRGLLHRIGHLASGRQQRYLVIVYHASALIGALHRIDAQHALLGQAHVIVAIRSFVSVLPQCMRRLTTAGCMPGSGASRQYSSEN